MVSHDHLKASLIVFVRTIHAVLAVAFFIEHLAVLGLFRLSSTRVFSCGVHCLTRGMVVLTCGFGVENTIPFLPIALYWLVEIRTGGSHSVLLRHVRVIRLSIVVEEW